MSKVNWKSENFTVALVSRLKIYDYGTHTDSSNAKCQMSNIRKHDIIHKKTKYIEKVNISVIITAFITQFPAFTEKNSGHTCRKFHYNIWFHLKMTSI